MPRIFLQLLGFALLLCGATLSCTKKTELPADPAARAKILLIEKGQQVYQSVCIACHNPNPAKDGVLGPALIGSSLELLEARVVSGTYPQGYTPKRNTKSMAALPALKNDVPALHAYLNSL